MKALLLLVLLAPIAAPAQINVGDPCTKAYNAEAARIHRDARVARRGLNPGVDQQVLQNVELLLRDAAMRAERCRAGDQGVQFRTINAAEKYCSDQANRRTIEMEKSFGARRLSESEAQILAAERAQIRQEQQACLRNHR